LQGHYKPNDFLAKRHDFVYTALWPLIPKERVPMDLGDAVTSMAGRGEFGSHVDKARQGLIRRVETPSVLSSAVADANVIQTLISDYQDPVDHLDRAIVRLKHAAGPKLAQHFRVGGPIKVASVFRNGVSHVRLAVGVAAVHRHCCGVRHAGTRVLTLTASVRSREANRQTRRTNRPSRGPLPPAPQGKPPAPAAVAARAAGRCRPCPWPCLSCARPCRPCHRPCCSCNRPYRTCQRPGRPCRRPGRPCRRRA